MRLGNFIQWERKIGPPIYQQDNLVVRPISRVLTLWWLPYGGSVRNWPIAIEIQDNGIIREIPIPNVNLLTQIGLSLTVGLISLLIWIAGKGNS